MWGGGGWWRTSEENERCAFYFFNFTIFSEATSARGFLLIFIVILFKIEGQGKGDYA